MASLTIKGIRPELLERLREAAKKRNRSLSAYVCEVLARAAGLEPGMRIYTDLDELRGTWSEKEAQEFLANTRPSREIDDSSRS